MLRISRQIAIPDAEIKLHAIRAQGAGGQKVNKASTAIHLRFDISASSLPDDCKGKLRQLTDYRISADGVIIIKAQRYRSQERRTGKMRSRDCRRCSEPQSLCRRNAPQPNRPRPQRREGWRARSSADN